MRRAILAFAFGLLAARGTLAGPMPGAPVKAWTYSLSDGISLVVREIPKKVRAGNDSPAAKNPGKRRDLLIATQKMNRPLNHVRFTNVDKSTRLLLPDQQPLEGYFLIRRQGGENSRLLVVTAAGKILNLPGGDVHVSPDGDQLFVVKTDPAESPPQLAVVDLASGKLQLDLKNAADPRGLLELGRGYRLLKTEAGTVIEPAASSDEKVALVSPDGKQVQLVAPLTAEAHSSARRLTRLLAGNSPSPKGLPTPKHHWIRLR